MNRQLLMPVIEDKIEYVYGRWYSHLKNTHRFKVVTKTGVARILDNPPKDCRAITMAELNRINQHLSISVSPETIKEIIRISDEYDRILVDNVKKPVCSVNDERTETANYGTYGKPYRL